MARIALQHSMHREVVHANGCVIKRNDILSL
jgi:hypothetical protein